METVLFVPAKGLKIRDPDLGPKGEYVPAEGKLVPANSHFFIRRVRDGDGKFKQPDDEVKTTKRTEGDN